MMNSRYLHASIYALAGVALAACATTSERTADTVQFEKPTAEEIAIVSRTEPLGQVKFWNEQYNLHPVDHDIALAFTRALHQINSFDRAREVASLAVVTHPESPDLFVELGRANANLGQSRDAIVAFGNALNLQPDNAYPYAAIGGLLDREGQHLNAQKAYVQALSRDPNRPGTLSNYGLSLALTGELVKAEAQLRKAVELPGASTRVRQNLALILGLQGKFDDARAIAVQDAPQGIAERNTDFLAQMVGGNAQLQAISDRAANQDAPKAAPVTPVKTVALAEPAQGGTSAATSTQPQRAPLRSRRARRGTIESN